MKKFQKDDSPFVAIWNNLPNKKRINDLTSTVKDMGYKLIISDDFKGVYSLDTVRKVIMMNKDTLENGHAVQSMLIKINGHSNSYEQEK